MKFRNMIEDLRFLISFLFGTFALILLILGVIGPAPAAGRLNLNLYTGVAMAIFSTVMFYLGVRSQTEKVAKQKKAAVRA